MKFAYMDAVIHASLRVHPNTGLVLERVVPKEGTTIDGYALPGGTIVGVNTWVIHRNKAIFGDDVDVFRPERWLEASDERLIVMKRNLFSFGAGPRMCIGRNIAMMQIGKFMVEFYRNFNATFTHPEEDWHVSGGW
ncbi:Pisatin demethylase [Lachnellula arida]|uniref:Pisatin demethylase n=1 Tax=Lachnellula arida TaxID=1316785 RepID=A0A8T9BBJ3_9HELO|nr:Pisatin demethylase [Lachnellula arida]